MLADYYHILKDLMKYKSISWDDRYAAEMQGISMYLLHFLQEHKFATQVVSGYGNPIVVASYGRDTKLPICLLYGHYDVQYADILEGWKHDPFNLHIAQERIYGRGVADNKGQFLIHLLSICALIKEGNLGYNIIVVLEGNEETGSAEFQRFLQDYRDYLHSDFCLISDSTIVGDQPCLDVGYRGSLNLHLTLKTADTDIHSGLYGGIVPNALRELNHLLDQLYDTQHRITIPYFYYDVDEVSADVLVRHKKLAFDREGFVAQTGVQTLLVDKEYDVFTQLGLKPSIEITGISGGYMEWFKNAVPGHASAHLNVRIVAHQTVANVYNAIQQWIQTILPAHVEYTLDLVQSIDPIKIDVDNAYIRKAQKILESITQQKVHYSYGGGSLPIVSYIAKVFAIPLVLVPLVNDDCRAHGVDENFRLDLIQRGFAFSRGFFAKKG